MRERIAEPEVRIHSPPAESRANFRFLSGFPTASTVGNARLPRRGSGCRSNIAAYSRPRASRYPGGSGSAYPSLAVKGDAPDVMSIRGRAIVKPSLSGLLDILNHLQAYHAHARRALVRITSGRSGPHRFAAIDSEFLMQRMLSCPPPRISGGRQC